MPSVAKVLAEVPPRTLRDVDRASRNPETAGERGRHRTGGELPLQSSKLTKEKEGLSDEGRCADSKEKTRLKSNAKKFVKNIPARTSPGYTAMDRERWRNLEKMAADTYGS